MGSGVPGNNISDKYRFQWIAPERTGSRKVCEILNYYGFKNGDVGIFQNNTHHYSHVSSVNEKYNDYGIICSSRNPYGRVYSLFKNFCPFIQDKGIEGFKKYLMEYLPKEEILSMVLNPPNRYKSFDYVIRLEHIKDDLMKLPFISDVLSETQIEMITSHGKEIDNWEKFYDNEMKETVYNLIEYQFKLWGYQK